MWVNSCSLVAAIAAVAGVVLTRFRHPLTLIILAFDCYASMLLHGSLSLGKTEIELVAVRTSKQQNALRTTALRAFCTYLTLAEPNSSWIIYTEKMHRTTTLKANQATIIRNSWKRER